MRVCISGDATRPIGTGRSEQYTSISELKPTAFRLQSREQRRGEENENECDCAVCERSTAENYF